jgi:hypothetical protein
VTELLSRRCAQVRPLSNAGLEPHKGIVEVISYCLLAAFQLPFGQTEPSSLSFEIQVISAWKNPAPGPPAPFASAFPWWNLHFELHLL